MESPDPPIGPSTRMRRTPLAPRLPPMDERLGTRTERTLTSNSSTISDKVHTTLRVSAPVALPQRSNCGEPSTGKGRPLREIRTAELPPRLTEPSTPLKHGDMAADQIAYRLILGF